MILQALYQYYQRLEQEQSGVALEGFESKEIPFLIILSQRGEFIRLQDTRTSVGKKLVASSYIVPKESGRSGSNAWKVANLLWDHYGYVLAYPKSNAEADIKMALKQHEAFITKTKTVFEKYPNDTEIEGVYRFLVNGNYKNVFSDTNWQECIKIPGCNLSFRFEEQLKIICENENVRAYIVSMNDTISGDKDNNVLSKTRGMCLLTGKYGLIERLHPRTPILGSKSNAKIVSFQKNMGFDSYGKEQSFNAPMSKTAIFAYSTALNRMLSRGSSQYIQVGDASTVFWAARKNPLEDMFADFFGEKAKENSTQDNESIKALYKAPEKGTPPLQEDLTPFYVLGLSPNASRIAVRFWYAGTAGQVAKNIRQYFDDISMVHKKNEPDHLSLFRLLVSTAIQTESKNIQPNLSGDFMKAILTGTPYPKSLLNALILRVKVEQSKKDQKTGKSLQNVTYPRASLIKAILVRDARIYQKQEKEVDMSLDLSNNNPGYRLGRLFAALERAQELANPNINSSIRDRFYGSASSIPVAAFPQLLKLKNHHISKLNNKGMAIYLEKQIGEIMDGLGDFPAHLSLADQGRFAIGYYHQRQAFFTKAN